MARTGNEAFVAMVSLQSELASAQARCATELWRRYVQLAQEAQLATLSTLQSHEPETTREAQAMTIDAAQQAIEAAAAGPEHWQGKERRTTTIAVSVPIERRRKGPASVRP